MASARDELASLGDTIRESFAQNRRVLSFGEYLDLVLQSPERQLRSAAQYMVDCFDHYGTEEVVYPWGPVRRFKLFDGFLLIAKSDVTQPEKVWRHIRVFGGLRPAVIYGLCFFQHPVSYIGRA